MLYAGEVPADAVVTLYGTVGVFLDEGSIIGLTSQSQTSTGAAPEIGLGSSSNAGS